jgi:hypothetical protein
MRRPPVLNNRCCRLVNDQLWMARGQGEPAQEIAEIVRDDAQEQPHLIGPEVVASTRQPMRPT